VGRCDRQPPPHEWRTGGAPPSGGCYVGASAMWSAAWASRSPIGLVGPAVVSLAVCVFGLGDVGAGHGGVDDRSRSSRTSSRCTGRGRAWVGRWHRGLTVQPTGRVSAHCCARVTARSGPDPGDGRRRLRRSWPASVNLGLFVGIPGAALAYRGMGFGTYVRLTGTCRIAQAAPCSPNRAAAGPAACTSGDQEGHRAVPSPGGAEGPSLWPSTLERSCSCCALAGQGR
jgi:hypothetical protein